MTTHPEILDVLEGRRRWCVPVGDCREVLASMPDGSARCCVTSPPYWGLRDYGVDGQLGLERTPEEYVANMVDVFREVRRVLADDGTAWVNLGDSYAANRPYQVADSKHVDVGNNGAMRVPVGLKPKDLVGIPWRVAFALQAADYLGRIRREPDRAWLAALVDGEGCITILQTKSGHGSGDSYPPVLQVRMCDIKCIERAAAITGLGMASPRQEPPSQGGQRGSYQWRLNGRKAADTIAEIYPYLLIKRKQAIVAWNQQAVRDGYETKRGTKIPTDSLEKQRMCRDIIQKLNRREVVDLPSWMIEPPLPVGPGWYLRQDVIWSKPNPMPESVTDRCTKAHEYIFLLTKSERYFYDAEAIKEKAITGDPRPAYGAGQEHAPGSRPSSGTRSRMMPPIGGVKHADAVGGTYSGEEREWPDKRNARSVWSISPKPFHEAHFATMPEALADRCVRAGSAVGDLCIDPFNGAGTTGLVSVKHGRRYVGPELNPAYAAIARRRIAEADNHLFTEARP